MAIEWVRKHHVLPFFKECFINRERNTDCGSWWAGGWVPNCCSDCLHVWAPKGGRAGGSQGQVSPLNGSHSLPHTWLPSFCMAEGCVITGAMTPQLFTVCTWQMGADAWNTEPSAAWQGKGRRSQGDAVSREACHPVRRPFSAGLDPQPSLFLSIYLIFWDNYIISPFLFFLPDMTWTPPCSFTNSWPLFL